METTQYTIRRIPSSVMRRAEIFAKTNKRSKNSVLVEALSKAFLPSVSSPTAWLGKYIGIMDDDTAETIIKASAELRKVGPKDYL